MKYKNKKSLSGAFKSKLEEYCWHALKEANLQAYYEGISLEILPSVVFATSYESIGKKKQFKLQRPKVKSINYIPDFTNSKELADINWVIETKGYFTPEARIKWKLLKKYLVDKEYDWTLYMPTTKKEVDYTVQKIIDNGKINNSG